MQYEIKGGNLPVVICNLASGETMITERGSMAWMSPNMKMETNIRDFPLVEELFRHIRCGTAGQYKLPHPYPP